MQHIAAWARDKQWWWRVIPVGVFAWLFLQCLQSEALQRSNPIALFDFGIHELGHVVFIPFGAFMTVLGGSLFQCLFPLLWAGTALWKHWYMGAALCIAWCGYNLYDVAVYAGDARTRMLPLATVSNDYDSAHDWYQILSRLHKLSSDIAIEHALRVAGGIVMGLGLLAAVALLFMIIEHWRTTNDSTDNSA